MRRFVEGLHIMRFQRDSGRGAPTMTWPLLLSALHACFCMLWDNYSNIALEVRGTMKW